MLLADYGLERDLNNHHVRDRCVTALLDEMTVLSLVAVPLLHHRPEILRHERHRHTRRRNLVRAGMLDTTNFIIQIPPTKALRLRQQRAGKPFTIGGA